MSKKTQAVLERTSKKAPPVVDIEQDWPLGTQQPPKPKENGLNKLSAIMHTTLVKMLSNLRLSLTLRIALHYVGELLLTMIPVLLAAMIALSVAQIPKVNQALDALESMRPAQEDVFTGEQLNGLPFAEVKLISLAYDGGIAGFGQRIGLMFSDFE